MQSTKKSTKQKVDEITKRLYDDAMRSYEEKKTAIIAHNQKAKEQQKIQYTYHPNITKKKFVKYPNPVRVHPSKETYFDMSRTSLYNDPVDSNNRSQQLKAPVVSKKHLSSESAANLTRNLEKMQSRVTSLYSWNSDKQHKLKNRFLNNQLNQSLEQLSRSISKESNHGIKSTRFLNGSLQNLHVKGTEDFYVRQRKANIMKREKEYLKKFPNSYIYTYKEKFEASMDSTPTHYLSFGQYSQIRR